MNTNLKFGLSQVGQHAPRWLVNTLSVITVLIAARHYLVAGLPIDSPAAKQLITAWTDYILDIIQVALAVTVIFSGQHKKHKS